MRVLLMVLVHHTGDPAWLEPPFEPRRDVRLIPDPDAGLPTSVQRTIRSAALDAIAAGQPLAMRDPGDRLMQRMMSVCLGERVPAEYAELNREEMGLVSRFMQWQERPSPEELDAQRVLIVGAGVCGIALGVSLKKLGVPFTIIEKHPQAGGTWFRNRYPGCGVDTPNHAYSFSFGGSHPWSRYFSQREEVLDYLSKVVEEFELRPNIRFETTLERSSWDESTQQWVSQVRAGDGRQELRSRFLVSGIGQLSDPAIPDIAGASDFAGLRFHSVDWPEDLDVSGRRVAVIGTGATAMQLVPAIANRASRVAVFQRTAQWARPIPGYADPIRAETQLLMAHVPLYAKWFRFNMFWRYGDGLLRHLKTDPDWAHPERAVNSVNDRHRQEMTEFIRSKLNGRPDLIAKSLPDYPAYGKRILLDNDWYGTIRKPNVDLFTEGMRRLTPGGIELVSGRESAADIIVYATGFKVAEMASRLNLTGRGGRTLSDAWGNHNAAAYLGLMVPSFPNFFCMLGPGSGPGHGGSSVFQAECQARYIAACIVRMHEARIAVVDVKRHVHEAYLGRFDEEHRTLVWAHPRVSSYYRNGRGRVFTVMPWRFVDYWRMTHDPDLDDFNVG